MTELQKKNLKLEVHKRVAFEDLHWDCIRERLASRTKSSGLVVDSLIKQFISNFFSTLKVRWLNSSDLLKDENLVVAAICECHGCDEIIIERSSAISIGLGSFPIYQSLRFRALNTSANKDAGSSALSSNRSGLVRIGPKIFRIEIRTYQKLVIFSIVCVLVAAVFYALAAILVVYALAVFMHFLSAPGAVTIIATQRADIGLALLSFLVGLAALFGGGLKRILRLFQKPKPPSSKQDP